MSQPQARWQIPLVGYAWLLLAGLLFALSFVPFVLRDPRFAGEMATLVPDLWLPTLRFDSTTLLRVGAVNTGLSLAWTLLFFALVETALASYFAGVDEKLTRPLFRAVAIFVTFWSFYGHMPLWDIFLSYAFPRSPQLLYPRVTVVELAAQHLDLVVVSSIITVAIGLTLGVMMTREQFREFLPLVSDLVNSGQTVPTLAIVAIMVPIIGLGFWPTIIALILYGMLPIVRNTIAGLEAVNPFLIDSAKGMGMTANQILWRIELPNASNIILAGIRTSVVINVGTAALGAFAGSGGLGVPIAGGLSQQIRPFVLQGALPAALLAILIDYVLGRIEYVLTPKGLQIES